MIVLNHAGPRCKLLVVTTSRVDVRAMQENTRLPSCYRMGRHRRGGHRWKDSKIVVVTSGLLLKWYANEGEEALRSFDGIFFDEFHHMETDPEYALLWEVAVKVSKRRRLHIRGASATWSSYLKEKLAHRAPRWVECLERPHSVERYETTVSSTADMYSCATHLSMSLLRQGKASLVFLPGKWEISALTQKLVAAGIDPKKVVPFHAELDESQLEAVKRPTDYARIILSTSFAETSVTLPDVDVVIDVCLARRT